MEAENANQRRPLSPPPNPPNSPPVDPYQNIRSLIDPTFWDQGTKIWGRFQKSVLNKDLDEYGLPPVEIKNTKDWIELISGIIVLASGTAGVAGFTSYQKHLTPRLAHLLRHQAIFIPLVVMFLTGSKAIGKAIARPIAKRYVKNLIAILHDYHKRQNFQFASPGGNSDTALTFRPESFLKSRFGLEFKKILFSTMTGSFQNRTNKFINNMLDWFFLKVLSVAGMQTEYQKAIRATVFHPIVDEITKVVTGDYGKMAAALAASQIDYRNILKKYLKKKDRSIKRPKREKESPAFLKLKERYGEIIQNIKKLVTQKQAEVLGLKATINEQSDGVREQNQTIEDQVNQILQLNTTARFSMDQIQNLTEQNQNYQDLIQELQQERDAIQNAIGENAAMHILEPDENRNLEQLGQIAIRQIAANNDLIHGMRMNNGNVLTQAAQHLFQEVQDHPFTLGFVVQQAIELLRSRLYHYRDPPPTYPARRGGQLLLTDMPMSITIPDETIDHLAQDRNVEPTYYNLVSQITADTFSIIGASSPSRLLSLIATIGAILIMLRDPKIKPNLAIVGPVTIAQAIFFGNNQMVIQGTDVQEEILNSDPTVATAVATAVATNAIITGNEEIVVLDDQPIVKEILPEAYSFTRLSDITVWYDFIPILGYAEARQYQNNRDNTTIQISAEFPEINDPAILRLLQDNNDISINILNEFYRIFEATESASNTREFFHLDNNNQQIPIKVTYPKD